MGINPFDEPDVTEAKAATQRDARRRRARCRRRPPTSAARGSRTRAGFARPTRARRAVARRARGRRAAPLRPGEYIALLAYLPETRSAARAAAPGAAPRLSRATGRRSASSSGPLPALHRPAAQGRRRTPACSCSSPRAIARTWAYPGSAFTLAALHRAQAEGDLVTLARPADACLRLDLPPPRARTRSRRSRPTSSPLPARRAPGRERQRRPHLVGGAGAPFWNPLGVGPAKRATCCPWRTSCPTLSRPCCFSWRSSPYRGYASRSRPRSWAAARRTCSR